MASVFVMTNPPTYIDYSLIDNRVRSFELRGVALYDENEEITTNGWEGKLVEFVKEQGLDIDDGRGLHAFVYGLIEKGLLEV
jgi:hypothetical protein